MYTYTSNSVCKTGCKNIYDVHIEICKEILPKTKFFYEAFVVYMDSDGWKSYIIIHHACVSDLYIAILIILLLSFSL